MNFVKRVSKTVSHNDNNIDVNEYFTYKQDKMGQMIAIPKNLRRPTNKLRLEDKEHKELDKIVEVSAQLEFDQQLKTFFVDTKFQNLI